MTNPLVSVLTPSFGQARWLKQNLNSVAAQSYSKIEHVVMDGGSTDGSVEILQSADHSVRWRSEPDRGQSHALNKAFAESRGEIIGWLNSDDAYFDRYAVAAAVRLFQRHPEVDLVYGHAALVNADGLILQVMWAPPFHYGLLRNFNFIVQPAAFIRRSAIEDFFADESFDYAMDRELWLRLGRSHAVKRLNRLVAIDRHHLERKSYTRMDLAAADGDRLVEMYDVPAGNEYKLPRRAMKIALRVCGISQVRAAARPVVFGGVSDGSLRLAMRQIAATRASMPAEGVR